ncbi:MAG: hypothetical protein K0R17_3269 [Rariglobus sp.]|nr:hypothetical protein [Rariglobus sp.]
MVLNKVFDNVLDIPGVDGVCLFGLSGQVFLNRMPAFLSPDVFSDALRRIAALYETMDENFLPCDDYLLRVAEKWILFRRTDQAVLLVLAAETANFASTRMVTNMALKHLTPAALAEMASDVPAPAVAAARVPTGATATPFSAAPFPPAVIAAEPAPAAAPAPAPEPHKIVRMFRGRPY